MTTAAATAPLAATAAEVQNATVTFGGVCALDNVSISVDRGQIRGLIGPNGAGKSTLVNVLAGVYRPRGCDVLLQGASIKRRNPQVRAKLGLGRTFQRPTMFETLTLRENLRIAERFGRRRRAECTPEQDDWLGALVDEYGFTEWLDVVCSHVPYPVQKLADTLRALLAIPTVLVVDEPAAGLPIEDKQRVMELLSDAREKMSMAILVIDHDVSMMFALSDRITVLNGGMLIAEGAPVDIARHPDVVRAYLGEPV